ncbi:hypothetical protein [Campylobacter taeniopygiae]|uniref:Uncharacterized protein n=1 Tax=Campylobacter taeniopygiae TaxID=2510188 RepID=A0ABY2TGM8_9BACT|nr:hypothetical protein [Campylobacter taeniopygiae]TKX33270.1 hypothetical protein CQA75_08325 [Campylobacter taeniopygiae]
MELDKERLFKLIEYFTQYNNDLMRLTKEYQNLKMLQEQGIKITIKTFEPIFADCFKNSHDFSIFIRELIKDFSLEKNQNENKKNEILEQKNLPVSYLE